MPTKSELDEIYKALSAPFPPEAIERTTAAQTGRGYDTTGVKVAYVIDRMNRVLGLGRFRIVPKIGVRERQSRNGRPMFEAVCEVIIQLGDWHEGQFVAFAEASAAGGHLSALEADAMKGALSNAIKKAASVFGVAWTAYAGRLDEDAEPIEEEPSDLDDERWPTHRRPERKPTEDRSPQAGSSGERERAPHSSGRVTSAQLAKLRELVEETGGEWAAFRADIRQRHGINLEYADTKLGSALITELVGEARKRRANGHAVEGRAR